MAMLLGVNVDHIATIRQARKIDFPDPIKAALLAEIAGADGITMHLREDRRHILDNDIIRATNELKTRLNLEMAITAEMLDFACEVKPYYACFVPEKREELTTEGGLNLFFNDNAIANAIEKLSKVGITVSLFIDPEIGTLNQAKQLGAKVVELHTGEYAISTGEKAIKEISIIEQAVEHGLGLGLQVNAGHGLNYTNTSSIAAISGITELNIGHSIVARALFSGWVNAVSEMKDIIYKASK